MGAINEKHNQSKSNYVVYAFIGVGLGSFLGLVAYVKDWITF
ncbi:hypothetical protein [Cytobacillus pseudoceanisediminis]